MLAVHPKLAAFCSILQFPLTQNIEAELLACLALAVGGHAAVGAGHGGGHPGEREAGAPGNLLPCEPPDPVN